MLKRTLPTRCLLISFLLCSIAVYAPAEPRRAAAPTNSDDWYRRSWIHSHWSINPASPDIDFISRQIREAGIDAIQHHTGRQNLWNAVRKARLDEELGFKMVATINAAGTWYPHYEDNPAYVKRIHPDGSLAGRWDRRHLCFNAPVVRERIIPDKYNRLPAGLKPDQVWIDECIITVNLCWCEHCRRLYREQYASEPPTTLTDDNYDEWIQWTTFHRESFERWMADVRKAVDDADPDILVTFNHAWFVEQPETPPAYIKNLCADIHQDSLELGIYARYGGSGSIPFDLMPGLGADKWAGVQPKKQDRIYNDVALITAHGGRWNIGEYPTDSGNGKRPADVYLDLARKGAVFARERQSFCQHSKPVPYVALLHSASTHYEHVIRNFNGLTMNDGYGKTSDGTFRRNPSGRINSRVYWPGNNPIDDSLVGAYESLLENHIHFNFTIEDRLSEDLKQTALLVLADQHRLSPASVNAIESYVRNGGRVLATGSTRHAGLDDLLDVESEQPKQVGKGRTLYLRDNIFRHHAERSGYSHKPNGDGAALRARADRIFKSLLPENPYELEAPPWIEWTIRRSEDEKDLLIHLINRRINWSLPGADPNSPYRCSIALDTAPEAVTLEPGGEVLEWRLDEGRVVIDIAPGAVPYHRIIRISK